MPPLLEKLVRYFFTAGMAAVVDVGGFVLLAGRGVPILAAATCSFIVAAVVNYLLSSRFVFQSDATTRRFLLFFAAALVGLTINVSVTYLAAVQLGLGPALAKLAGVGTAFLANFAINTALVFRR